MKNYFRRTNWIQSEITILIFGFGIRLALSAITRHPWDMDIWVTIGKAVLDGQNPYALPANALLYPPLWSVFCAIGQSAYRTFENVFIENMVTKLPIIFADIIVAIMIKKIIYKFTNNDKKALLGLMLYIFNPVVIIVSSMWGMFDAIPTLFAVLALFFLIDNSFFKSGILLGIGISFKGLFPGILLPFFLYYVWKVKKDLMALLKYLVFSFLIPIIVSTPFLIIDYENYFSGMFFHFDRAPQNLTFWFGINNLLKFINLSTESLQKISSFCSIIFFLLFYFLIFYNQSLKNVFQKNRKKFAFNGYLIVIFLFYISSNTVNEQYSIWIFPTLIISMLTFHKDFKRIYYLLTLFVLIFITINVGPNFFIPILDVPEFWTKLQYSSLFIFLLSIIGMLYSILSFLALSKIIRNE